MRMCNVVVASVLAIAIPQIARAQAPAAAKKAAPVKPAAKAAPAKPAAKAAKAAPAKKAAAEPATEAKLATFDVKDIRLCSGVNKRAPVDDKSTFNTGEKAYLWLKLRPNTTKTESPRMKIAWSWKGKPYWTMDEVPVKWGRIWYYKTVDQPGDWKVVVVDENDTEVASREFTATGDPYVRPKPADDKKTN
jgi:nucleoid-associated protein YgaU